MSEPYALGIDIGGTNVKALALRPDGTTIAEAHFPTEDGRENPGWKWRVPAYVKETEGRLGPATWIGITSPGVAARDGKSIWWMQGKMWAAEGLDWTAHLGRQKPVAVANDAQAALMGEVWKGAAAGKRDVILYTLGTGVGGAIMCGGKVLRGNLGRAGHLGHTSLDPDGDLDLANTPGSIELAMGETTVQRRTGGRYASTRDLVESYARGDGFAAEVWLKSVKALAASVVSFINVVDPEIVVIGGGIAKAGEHLFKPLAEFMDRFEWRPHDRRVPVVPAVLGDESGALGAAWYAIHFEEMS